MSYSDKIKALNNKVQLNDSQYNLDKKNLLIFLLSSGNINKYEFLTVKDVLPEKAPALKIFEDSPLEKELKAQTSGGEKQYLN